MFALSSPLSRFAIKAGLAATAIYYIRNQGIWKSSDEAIESSKKLKAALSPYIQDVKSQIPIDWPELPETENICQLSKQYWNCAVRTSFAFLVKLPNHVKEYSTKGREALLQNPEIKKFYDSFSASETSFNKLANQQLTK